MSGFLFPFWQLLAELTVQLFLSLHIHETFFFGMKTLDEYSCPLISCKQDRTADLFRTLSNYLQPKYFTWVEYRCPRLLLRIED